MYSYYTPFYLWLRLLRFYLSSIGKKHSYLAFKVDRDFYSPDTIYQFIFFTIFVLIP